MEREREREGRYAGNELGKRAWTGQISAVVAPEREGRESVRGRRGADHQCSQEGLSIMS